MAGKKLKAFLYVTTTLGLGLPAPALAQQAIGEVVVTARRIEERLQDVPISITVFNQQQLANRNVVTAADLATYTPSLSADKRFGSETGSFALRGFTKELRTAASVAVYFADVVAPRGGTVGTGGGDGVGPGSFFDLQNVQVLKGPQGTLFGRNTTGGAILLVPSKPTDQFGGYVEGSIGNLDLRRLEAVINVPMNDNVRLRVGVDRQKRDGYQKNISGIGPSRFADVDYFAGRASMVVDITPSLENYTIGAYSEADSHGTLSQLFACNPAAALGGLFACPQLARQEGLGFYTVQNSLPDARSWSEQWQIVNTTTWRASEGLTIKNIISYAEYKSIQRQEVFGSRFLVPGFIPGLGNLPIGFAATSPPRGSYISDQSTFTDELQFQGRTPDDKLSWQAGGYYEKSKPLSLVGSRSSIFMNCLDLNNLVCTDVLGILAGAPGFGGSVTDSLGDVDFENIGVYGQATYRLNDKLSLTAGLRYTRDRTEGSGVQIAYRFPNPADPTQFTRSCTDPAATLANNCVLSFRQKSDAPTWLINLDYRPIEGVMVYGKYARGYRQGSVNAFGPSGFNTFGPEKVDTYEVGAKTSFHGKINGILNVAAFYNDFRDEQLQVSFTSSTNQATPTTGIVNAGKSRIWGIEVESSISPLDSLRFDLSYGYLNTKLQEAEPVTLPPGGPYDLISFTSAQGGPLPFAPKHKLSLTGTYTLPVPENVGTVSLSATYSYSSSYITATNSPFGRVGEANLVNLNLNWASIAGKPIDLALFATNLTNTKYTTFDLGTFDVLGFDSRALSEPRMYGMRLRWRFGG